MTSRRQPILFLVSAHNGLSQRAWIALTELGHEAVVAVVDSDSAMEAVVAEHRPRLIVSPFLRRMIPESIWSRHRCLIVHPGPVGTEARPRSTGRFRSGHRVGRDRARGQRGVRRR
jgi:hypothetical protein